VKSGGGLANSHRDGAQATCYFSGRRIGLEGRHTVGSETEKFIEPVEINANLFGKKEKKRKGV
jgi:hypothetical protein